jgi:ATP-dependent RNA helicase DDX46/PRP5
VKDITRMPAEEVAAYRKLLELKVHGKDVPKPIKTWIQSGQTSKLLDTEKKSLGTGLTFPFLRPFLRF